MKSDTGGSTPPHHMDSGLSEVGGKKFHERKWNLFCGLTGIARMTFYTWRREYYEENLKTYLFIGFQGVYTFDMETPAIQVDTFCVHGGPDGYITGIRGKVQCLSEEDKELKETDLERQEMIKEKCYLRFPTLPFIPKEPYDVIATDYDHFALVSGAKDKSFIQVINHPNLHSGLFFVELHSAQS